MTVGVIKKSRRHDDLVIIINDAALCWSQMSSLWVFSAFPVQFSSIGLKFVLLCQLFDCSCTKLVQYSDDFKNQNLLYR